MQAEKAPVQGPVPGPHTARGIRFDIDSFRTQLLVLVCLSLFSSFALAGHFLATRTLYWDNLRLYSFFHDNLHSLNYFGEVQWWSPHAPDGFPSYYLSILGNTNSTPLFVATGFVLWLLGLFGIHVTSYVIPYVLYFGLLVPFLFCLGFLFLARNILSDGRAVLFTILLASFSPGVVFNLSEPGFEMSVYSLFFAAALLNLQRNPGTRAFLLLCLSTMAMAVSLNHLSLYWNVIFVPLFIHAAFLFHPEGFKAAAGKVIASAPRPWWIAAMAAIILCMLPAIITYSQGPDLIRSSIGKRVYGFEELRPGNPLEVLAVSTPGVGFDWSDGAETGYTVKNAWYSPFISSTLGSHTSYGYMGLLALPLSITGLVFGRARWRKRLLLMIAVTSGVVILSGFSPLFAGILVLPTPLRAVNHYSDNSFRLGIFFLLILAAGMGVEALLGGKKHVRRWFLPVFGTTSLFSIGLFLVVFWLQLQPVSLFSLRIFGFMLMMTLLFSVVVGWFYFSGGSGKRRELFAWLLILTLIDVSTVSFGHVRSTMWGKNLPLTDPHIGSLGTGDVGSNHYLLSLLTPRSVLDLKNGGIDPESIPYTAFSLSARTALHSSGIFDGARNTLPYVVLPDDFRGKRGYRRFFGDPAGDRLPDARILRENSTYNRLIYEIESAEDALFFWRDLYSPFWTAEVNGNAVPVAKAFGAFKAVPVPAGRSVVEYRFSPGFLPWALAAAWIAFLFVAVSTVCILRRQAP